MGRAADIPAFALYGDRRPLPDPIHVEPIRDRAAPRAGRIAVHRHPAAVQLLQISEGSCLAVIDGDERALGPGDSLFVPRLSAHGFAFDPGCDGLVVTVPVATLSDALAGAAEVAARLDRPVQARSPELGRLAAALAAEHGARRPFRQAAAVALVRLAAVEVARLAPAPPPGREDAPARRIAARFLDLLEAHYAESRSVAFYADRLGRTPAHLNRVCKQALGQTASAQIRARVMAEARRELAHTARPVAEIAWRLGFDDPGYFARVFREMHGESPRAWRARAPRL